MTPNESWRETDEEEERSLAEIQELLGKAAEDVRRRREQAQLLHEQLLKQALGDGVARRERLRLSGDEPKFR